MREYVIEQVLKHKLIVIVRGVPREQLVPLAKALYDGGVRMLELTFCADGRCSDEETAGNIRLLCDEFDGRLCVGAGTVLTEKQVELAAKAGATFMISPDVCTDVIRKTRELGLVSMPGAMTPSEVQTAHKAGADFVKLFPASAMGAGYVKAITAPLSHVRLLAVGGIDERNMNEYFDAGVKGIGVGGNLVSKSLLAQGDYARITALAKEYVCALEKRK